MVRFAKVENVLGETTAEYGNRSAAFVQNSDVYFNQIVRKNITKGSGKRGNPRKKDLLLKKKKK